MDRRGFIKGSLLTGSALLANRGLAATTPSIALISSAVDLPETQSLSKTMGIMYRPVAY